MCLNPEGLAVDDRRVDLLERELIIVNLGLTEFFEVLLDQDVDAIQVDWRPPAVEDSEMLELLDELL